MKSSNHKYEIIIYWDNKEKIYIADVPELLGCMAHGESYFTALDSTIMAINLWLETAKEFKQDIPEPKGERLLFA